MTDKPETFRDLAAHKHGTHHPRTYSFRHQNVDAYECAKGELPHTGMIGARFDWIALDPMPLDDAPLSDFPAEDCLSAEAYQEIFDRVGWVLGLDRNAFERYSGRTVAVAPAKPRRYRAESATYVVEGFFEDIVSLAGYDSAFAITSMPAGAVYRKAGAGNVAVTRIE